MKQLILSIVTLLTLTIGIKGQNYVPFPTENANWNVYRPPTQELARTNGGASLVGKKEGKAIR